MTSPLHPVPPFQCIRVAKIPKSNWVTIAPRLSETSPDIIIVDLNEAGIKREFHRPVTVTPATLYSELKTLYDAYPSHKIIIKIGKNYPGAIMRRYVLPAIYSLSSHNQGNIRPVLCELSPDEEDRVINRHKMEKKLEVYPDEASAVEALKGK